MRYFLTLASLIGSVLATARTTPPSGALTVGSSGKYSTIQDAVDALSTSSTSAQSIFIYSGTYSEQVTIPKLSGALSVYGYTTDTSDYTNNVVTIEHSSSLLSGAANDEATGTVINLSASSSFYNINIKNTYGKGSQAIALAAYNSKQAYYGVGLYGYQDTLLAETGTQFYGKCYIEGAVDFIFGQSAEAWIDSSDIGVSAGGGSITASGRTSSSSSSWYVLNNVNIAAASGSSVSSGTVYLGRPWTEYARVMVQNSELSSIINSAGWSVWSTSTSNTEAVTFETYGNSGSGATSCCTASFSTKASSALAITTVLGSDYSSWVDTSYIA
ncbi:putative pectinesterase [Coleophoma crateriformis]|uniref:Pectinesterase n=1 Tax=Coleophoma crateriformis TaxID=565419 RepID=A0A3D8QLN3_9HELO|nr:putative pectinesterase [Coleophoma crateriformis]